MANDSSWGDTKKFVEMLTDIHGDKYDVTIVCSDGNQITANQIILCCASEVFEAMFRNKMEESKTKTVNIEDISGETMNMIIEFLSSGELPDLDMVLKDELVYALDKYDFKCMKTAIANKLQDVDVKHLCAAYELLKKLHMVEDKKKLASRMAFHFRSLPMDQLERLDSDAFFWIAQSLNDHLGSSNLKAGKEGRKDVWTNFLKIYSEWLDTKPIDAAKDAERVMQTVELHLLDVQTIVDLFSDSQALDLISPWMAVVVRRLMGLDLHRGTKRKLQEHMNQCGTEFPACDYCGCTPTRIQLHHPGRNCPARSLRCSVCNQELAIPSSLKANSSQAGLLTGRPLEE